MRNYVRLSEEEKNSIKQLHSSFYNGYATLSPNTNEQPLLQDKGPSDTNGITINNKGHVKTYTNHLVNESKEEVMPIDMTVDALMNAGVNLDSESGSPSYPDEDITIYEEDMTEGETCEACGGEMMEGECLECGSKTMYEEDLYEGADRDEDGELSPEELHKHFDGDGDGRVTTDEYKYHIDQHIMDILKPSLEVGLSLADAATLEIMKRAEGGVNPKSEPMQTLKSIATGEFSEITEKETCEQCGSEMKEGECKECGSSSMYEGEVMEKETCEQCGSEMVEGECLECGSMYEEVDEDLRESVIKQKNLITEMFNRFKKFN